MGNVINNQPVTRILANGVYVVKDGDTDWGGEVNRNFEILSELNKRAKLYITYGDVEEDTMPVKRWSYSIDGNDVIIQLPKQSVPKVDHFKLTIKMDGNTVGTFDNTQDETINIYSPTYADLVFKQNGQILQTYRPNGNSVDITIPSVTNHTLTITQNGQVLGTFNNSVDAVVDIPSTTSNKTLTITQGNQVLGTFDNSNNTTINIPTSSSGTTFVPKTLTITQDGQTLGNFVTDTNNTIDIPAYPNGVLDITVNGVSVGTFDIKTNATIDIPVSASAGASHTIERFNGIVDNQGNKQFSTIQTLNTANTESIKTYDLTLDIDGNLVNYNPFVDGNYSIVVSSGVGSSTGSNTGVSSTDISDYITFAPYPRTRDQVFYLHDFSGNQKTGNMVVEMPVHYVDVWDDYPTDAQGVANPNANHLCHFHSYGQDGTDMIFNMSPYMKVADADAKYATLSDVSESITFSPYPKNYDETYYIKDVANNAKSNSMTIDLPVHYVDIWDGTPKDAQGNPIPTTNHLSHFSTYGADGTDIILDLTAYQKVSDMPTNLSQFNNDANYATTTYVDTSIAAINVPENLSDLNIDLDLGDFSNNAGYIKEADADNKYAKLSDIGSLPSGNTPSGSSSYATMDDVNDLIADFITEAEADNKYLTIDDFYGNAGGTGGSSQPPVSGGDYITKAYADGRYLLLSIADNRYAKLSALPESLSDLHNDLDLGDFTNNAGYIKEADADNKYLTPSDADSKYLTITDASTTYAKISDVPANLSDLNVDLDLGDFTNTAGYIKEADADNKYAQIIDIPTALSQLSVDLGLSQLNNDMKLSDFTNDLKLSDIDIDLGLSQFVNDADFIKKTDADMTYIPVSEKGVPNGVALLNADGHLVLPSGIEIW